ncbi:MAG: hypothetical protein ACYC3S_01945 [Chloroflexota bacterium]
MSPSGNDLDNLVLRYKGDQESVYNTWFVESPARLKAFRSIRRGVLEVVKATRNGTFGNDFKGSPLETVLESITEQKQVFEGAAHPFYWKPKLRIPDIYENEANKQAFGQFLEQCLNATNENRLLRAIMELDRRGIKGLGPAVANILYFLHPTILPPFNTAMVRGFNALFSDTKKLGSWAQYLQMREVIVNANGRLAPRLSTDLGAFSGLLFDIGVGKIPLESGALSELALERAKIEKIAKDRHEQVRRDQQEESEHLKIQYLLTKTGRALGYTVHVATNDRSKAYEGQSLSSLTVNTLPDAGLPKDVAQTVGLIDVLWLTAASGKIVCAFEVEKSTSIYSGILRLIDLVQSLGDPSLPMFLVAPDTREREIRAQLNRPAFARIGDLQLRYILFSDLCAHCDGICKFGDDHSVLLKIAKTKGS